MYPAITVVLVGIIAALLAAVRYLIERLRHVQLMEAVVAIHQLKPAETDEMLPVIVGKVIGGSCTIEVVLRNQRLVKTENGPDLVYDYHYEGVRIGLSNEPDKETSLALRTIAIAIISWAEHVYLSTVDDLTGLYNRRGMTDHLRKEIIRARRYEHPLSLIVLDIDNLKSINDKFGHDVGDRVIVEISNIYRQETRHFLDIVARSSERGDEFIIILPETGISGAMTIAEKIRAAAESYRFIVGETELRLSVSVGVSGLDEDQELDGLLKAADNALYHAKGTGRNKVSVSR